MNTKIALLLASITLFSTVQTDAMRRVGCGKGQVVVRHRQTPQTLTTHKNLQQQFRTLQQNFGIVTSDETVNGIHPAKGRQGTQAEFDKVRGELNTLLSKAALTDEDIKTVQQKINAFAALHPARWPRSEDYMTILNLKVAAQAEAKKKAAAQN